MKKQLALAGAVLSLGMFAAPAQADIIDYHVSDATDRNACSHGLWTNSVGNGCGRNYSFQDGSKFSVDTHAGTGTFTGTAINVTGAVATLNLTLSGLLDTLAGTDFDYKARGGPYSPALQDYFTSAAGTITIGGETFSLNPNDPFAGNTAFQFGKGANDKTGDFGGSAWLNLFDPQGRALDHWDINFDLTPQSAQVPAPAGLLLFGFGLGGVYAARRSRRKRAA